MRVVTLDVETRATRQPNGCLLWDGATQKGYGALRIDGKTVRVHRLICEQVYGPAPINKPWALHKNECNNPLCIEGAHLYWGSPKDNTRDTKEAGHSTGGPHGGRSATECVNGHGYTEENTYWEPRGWGRACKECRRDAVRRSRARKAALCV